MRRWIGLVVALGLTGAVPDSVRSQPTVVVDPTRPVIVRPLRAPVARIPADAPRRLNDLPDPQSFIAPGLTGLYTALEAAPARRPARALAPYVAYTSPDTPADPKHFNLQQIVVKFAEGSGLRLRNTELVVDRRALAGDAGARLGRADLEPAQVESDLADFLRLVADPELAVSRAAPQVDEPLLDLLWRAAERRSKWEQPDPNLFYHVHRRTPDPGAAAALLQALRQLRIVEAAYFQPIPFNAVDIPPTTTIDVTPQQGYFRPSPAGVDVDFARHFAGGRGEGVRIVDVEGGWQTAHEDLPVISFGFGVNLAAFDGDHGTAVLGEIAGQENGFGSNGVSPGAMIGWSSFTNIDPFVPWQTYFYSVGNALLSAGQFLRAGDIALIEQHFPNLTAGPCPNACNCAQFGYVAVETMPFEHAAISILTAAGVVVVEAGGNGQILVTPASPRDSGAIVVGASDGALAPACFTNFGPRVNVHAWGGAIGSLGYADKGQGRVDAAGNAVLDAAGNQIIDAVPDPTLQASGTDSRQWYTRSFGGTSGASPIVVGAAALIQGTRMARGLAPLTSVQMRALLVATGTPQIAGTPPTMIGPLPNLRAAIATYIPDAGVFVRQTGAPTSLSAGAIFTETVTFKNTGGLAWSGYSMAIAPDDAGGFPFGTTIFTLGTATAPVNPGDEVSRVFSIPAPTAPGAYQLGFILRNPARAFMAASPRQPISVTTGPGAQFDNASLVITAAPGSLRSGQGGLVTVAATNTGSTTWKATSYQLRLGKTGRIALPLSNFATNTVGPGQTQTFGFPIICNSQGLSGFSGRMSGPSGAFGQSIGANVVCQP